MQVCKKCGGSFEPSSRFVNFCSNQCLYGRTFSERAIERKSISQKNYLASLSADEFLQYKTRLNSDDDRKLKSRQTYHKKLMSCNFIDLGWDSKRKRIILEQNSCCVDCGISEWKGVTISLEVDHIDGNNLNNERSNLKAICPNCHSITETWRGRNKPIKNGENKVTDEVLIENIRNTNNIRQALLLSGLVAKGDNYARAKKLSENS